METTLGQANPTSSEPSGRQWLLPFLSCLVSHLSCHDALKKKMFLAPFQDGGRQLKGRKEGGVGRNHL